MLAEDIARVTGKGGTAYDAVRSLRPRWLQSREATMEIGAAEKMKSPGPLVYVDGRSVGDVESLKTIPAESILEMRYLSVVVTLKK